MKKETKPAATAGRDIACKVSADMLARQHALLTTEKFTSLYDFAPFGYFTLSVDGEIMELNLAGARMVGKERSQLHNSSFGFFVSNESKPAFNLFLAEAFKRTDNVTCELTLTVNDAIPMVVSLTGALDESGERCLVTALDITQRIQAEEELRQSEELFKVIFENSLNPIMIADDAGNYLKVNQAAAGMFQYPVEKMLQMNVGDIQTTSSPNAARRYQEYLAKGFEIGEFGFIRPDKSEAFAQYHAVRVRENFNLSILSDITERKKAEEEVKQSQVLSKTIIDSIPGTFYMIDASGKYFGWNAYQRDEIVGQPDSMMSGVYAIDTIHPDDREIVGSRIANVLKNGAEEVVEGRVLLRGGPDFRWLLMTGCRMMIEGSPVLIGIGIDITERRQAAQGLKRIEWLLTSRPEVSETIEQAYMPPYGDLVALNTCRLILDSVGEQTLADIVGDYLNLLDTSSAVYEQNGDYALGIFSSGWCRFMDAASRKVCGTDDNPTALDCGQWHCHESCWSRASKTAIETGQPADIECDGGIRLYAIPIRVGDEIIGAINIGYGDPPRDEEKLRKLASMYQVSYEELLALSEVYESRPAFIVDLAKSRLHASARLIGVITERKRAEEALRESEEKFRDMANLMPEIIFESDSSGHLTYVNNNAFKVFGYPEDYPILGKSSLDFYTAESRLKAMENIRQKAAGNQGGGSNEYVMIRKDGSTFPALVYSNPIIKEGEPAGLRGIIVNITEIKQAEVKVIEQLNELRRWHKVTLGREGRVMELKQEVNELLKQHGEALRYESNFPDDKEY